MLISEQTGSQRLLHHGTDFSVYVSVSESGEKQILKVLNTSLPANTQIAHFNNEFHITQNSAFRVFVKFWAKQNTMDVLHW
jgi:hypothetical protein